ncbi:cytochrome P460 family protein [Psychromarinibacter sp. C21-152]|uniref:Cytochrome P460 family protein n=1 Tax=Psychromarinibacter sediminicola TaxID=3033385 RepID=A0AAE3NWN2_9RHOB|nr:cytochrome P460 family protein [Psychromarinibacter sediminicola]MDF0601982.1 cytochrome P460 family protein [Psychromarinibacter sediminicola]
MFARVYAAAALVALGTTAAAQDAPFGSDTDQDYAADLWAAMEEDGLIGPDAPVIFPYAGTEPHGFQLSTLYTTATVDGHEGVLVIKNNYGPSGVSADEVVTDPQGHLAAVTVMFKRAEGYDDETGNWFYAKYLKDGALDRNPAGMALAGLVGKNADAGCIACHQNAGGGDYLFTTDADLSETLTMAD